MDLQCAPADLPFIFLLNRWEWWRLDVDINLKLNWWLWSRSRYIDSPGLSCPVRCPTSNRAFVECSSWHEEGSVTNCIRWILEMKFQFDDQTSNLLVLMVHSKQHFLSQSGPQKQRKRFDDERQTTVYVQTSSPASDLEFSPSSHLLSRQNKWLVCPVCLARVISDTNPLPR